MARDRGRVTAAVAGVMGLLLGIFATVGLHGGAPALQKGGERRVIRPDKAPNTGLPFSPGILAGNTLYCGGTPGARSGQRQAGQWRRRSRGTPGAGQHPRRAADGRHWISRTSRR